MFDTILIKRFEKHPCYSKIHRREYAIEDGSSGQEISRSTDWSLCLHPGQKIDMSVEFQAGSVGDNYCPRCLTKSATSPAARTQCTSCSMWFQRVIEIRGREEDVPELEVQEESITLRQSQTGSVLSPADFKRARMLRKVNSIDIPLYFLERARLAVKSALEIGIDEAKVDESYGPSCDPS
jgi:hypothetical protein